MEIPLLYDLLIIFCASVAVLFICLKLKVPTTVGFLITGILAGPHGFGLIEAVHEVEVLAEIGVVLLLFSIGIEFSLKKFMEIKRLVLGGGTLQLLFTMAATTYIAGELLGLNLNKAIFIGFLVSLSSTAIVLKLLQEKLQIDAPHGRMALSILIFQDVAVVLMMLLVPYLAGGADRSGGPPWLFLVKGAAIIGLVIAGSKWVIPQVLYKVTATRSRELFLTSVLLICFGVAWITNQFGLSLALGAFLAGLIISESEYSHHTLANILPFKDIFTGLFFVSIGMLLDVGYIFQFPGRVGLSVLGVLVLKSVIVMLVVISLGYPLRVAILSGLALGQIGEFSFILALTGMETGLLGNNLYQLFLAVAVLSMGLTPVFITLGPRLVDRIYRWPLPKKLKAGLYTSKDMATSRERNLSDHLIVVGYGFNGRNVVQAAKAADIAHIVIEMNPKTVRKERMAGTSIFFGDAAREAVLEHAGVSRARIMVVAVPDPATTRGVIALSKKMNPALFVIVRTRFFREMASLYNLGADVVVPEEFETSVEIFTRVLQRYMVPRQEIERFTSEIRADGYQMLRISHEDDTPLSDLELKKSGVDLTTLRLPESSPLAGKTIAQGNFRKIYGVTVLAIKRDQAVISNPDPETMVLENDIMVVMGGPRELTRFAGALDRKEE